MNMSIAKMFTQIFNINALVNKLVYQLLVLDYIVIIMFL